MRLRTRAALVALTVSAASVFMLPTAAQAAGCETIFRGGYGGSFFAWCDSGPGSYYRARVSCKSSPDANIVYFRSGLWTHEGEPVGSIALCQAPTPYAVGSGWIQWA